MTGKPQRYMELSASPQRFGGIVVEMTLPWLRTPANAEAVGTRVLARMSGRRYRVTYSTDRIDLRPGNWTQLDEHPEWPTPDVDPHLMTLAVDITPQANTTIVEAECILSAPTISVTAHSVAVPPTAGAAIEVTVANGIATFKLVDKDGQALRGARVSFDGSPAKTTDAQGTVNFNANRGTHTLAVEAEGVTPFTVTIQI